MRELKGKGDDRKTTEKNRPERRRIPSNDRREEADAHILYETRYELITSQTAYRGGIPQSVIHDTGRPGLQCMDDSHTKLSTQDETTEAAEQARKLLEIAQLSQARPRLG
jgi:hypothetical protein